MIEESFFPAKVFFKFNFQLETKKFAALENLLPHVVGKLSFKL
jgi:hypothetical protein